MSVRIMSRVWDYSAHDGTELLMLLAIADFADDEGRAYPAVGTLATKCRMSPRNANLLLAKLRESGELEVSIGTGPRGTNSYRIRQPAAPLKSPSPLKPASTPEALFTPEAPFTLKPSTPPPEAGFPKPLKPASDKPSMNHQEPSSTSARRTRRTGTPPVGEIVAAYHEALPTLPRVKVLDSKKRKASIAMFWAWVLTSKKSDGTRRATTFDEAMGWIRDFFQRAACNDFVMGRTGRGSGHEGWQADFDYLVSDRGRVQVIEKTGPSS